MQTSIQTLIAVTYRLPCPTGQTFLAKLFFHYLTVDLYRFGSEKVNEDASLSQSSTHMLYSLRNYCIYLVELHMHDIIFKCLVF